MIFLLFCLLAPAGYSQITSIQCNQTITDSGFQGRRAVYDNRFQGCNLWTLEWNFTPAAGSPNAVALMELDGALDNNGVPGTFGTNVFYPSSLNSPQPIGLQIGILVLHGYAPWISVNVGAPSGGTISKLNIILRGFYSQTPESFPFIQGGNGSGEPIQGCNGVANITVASGTTARIIAANSNFFFTHICGFTLTSPGVAIAVIGGAAVGMCGAGITSTQGTFNMVAGVPINVGDSLGSLYNLSNSFDICLSAPSGSINGMIRFNQNNTQQ